MVVISRLFETFIMIVLIPCRASVFSPLAEVYILVAQCLNAHVRAPVAHMSMQITRDNKYVIIYSSSPHGSLVVVASDSS